MNLHYLVFTSLFQYVERDDDGSDEQDHGHQDRGHRGQSLHRRHAHLQVSSFLERSFPVCVLLSFTQSVSHWGMWTCSAYKSLKPLPIQDSNIILNYRAWDHFIFSQDLSFFSLFTFTSSPRALSVCLSLLSFFLKNKVRI